MIPSIALRAPLRIVLGALLLVLSGCSAPRAGVVYQNSTIDALLDGNYDGEVTFAQLRQHGDFGLGTFDALDGEMLAIDGRFFQVRSNGRVHEVPPTARTPFAAVTFFRPDTTHAIDEPLTYRALQDRLDAMRPNDGRAYAFCLRGRFGSVRTRSVPRQAKPYPRLVEVVKTQPVFDLTDVSGTLVGFWFPPSMRHLNVPGYHFHFLTDDRSAGGHVLDLAMLGGTAQMQELTTVAVELPERPPTTQPSGDRSHELEAVEK